MTNTTSKQRYRPTEAKYKGGAHEMYVTYDLEQRTRSGSAIYPKVKRVYIAGDVQDWQVGRVKKRSGRDVYGVRIAYDQRRKGYHRKAYTAERGGTAYQVAPASVEATAQHFMRIEELPERARNVHFYTDARKLPEKYRDAVQDVR
jgi:hypothetical protein